MFIKLDADTIINGVFVISVTNRPGANSTVIRMHGGEIYTIPHSKLSYGEILSRLGILSSLTEDL